MYSITAWMVQLCNDGQTGKSPVTDCGLTCYADALADPDCRIDADEFILLARELADIDGGWMPLQEELRLWLDNVYLPSEDLSDEMIAALAAYHGQPNGWDIVGLDVARLFRELERRRPELILIGPPRTYDGDPAEPLAYFGLQIRWASLEEHERAEIDRLQQQLEGDA